RSLSSRAQALRFPVRRGPFRGHEPNRSSTRRTNRRAPSRMPPCAARNASTPPAGGARPVRGDRGKKGFHSGEIYGATRRGSPPARAPRRPRRENVRQRALRRVRQAKGQRGTFAGGHERGEQVKFLRRHLREAVEPQAGEPNFRFSIFDFRFALQRGRGQIEQTVRVLQFVLTESVEI